MRIDFNLKRGCSLVVTLVLSVFLFIGLNNGFAIAAEAKLPQRLIFSCYDVGGSGYIQASAIADALGKKYGTKIRLIPSGTSIGRMIPVVNKRADMGFLADEVFFAAEGMFDFASEEWGPQDIRVILAKPTSIGCATTKKSGIITAKDIRGKRVAFIPGADSLNVKMEGFLAFGGLTWNDVQRVDFPSFAAASRALIEGHADVSISNPPTAHMYELESSPMGLHWIEFPPEDKEGWARMTKVVPFLSPMVETIGPGMSKDNPKRLPAYRYPQITVRADADPEFVYQFTKAMDEAYSLYLPAHAAMADYAVQKAGVPPAGAPYHEGAIRYLKEVGVWKAEYDEINKKGVEHIKALLELWDEAMVEKEEKKIGSKQFPEMWMKKRAQLQ